jgi:hypothetical protein
MMNFSSATGQFSTANGLAINSTEHFTISYQSNDVLLTVASGATSSVGQLKASGSPMLGKRLFYNPAQFGGSTAATRKPGMADFSGLPVFSFRRLQASPSADVRVGLIRAAKPSSMVLVDRQSILSPRIIAAIAPATGFNRTAMPRFPGAGASHPIPGFNYAEASLVGTNGRRNRMIPSKALEYNINLLSLLGRGASHPLWKGWRQLGDPNAASFGYVTFSGTH